MLQFKLEPGLEQAEIMIIAVNVVSVVNATVLLDICLIPLCANGGTKHRSGVRHNVSRLVMRLLWRNFSLLDMWINGRSWHIEDKHMEFINILICSIARTCTH